MAEYNSSKSWGELKTQLREIDDLRQSASLLHWDQATYMPSGGAAARGRQIATLSRLAHERQIDPRLGDLIERLIASHEFNPDSDEAALLRVAKRDYEKAALVPAEFQARFSEHSAQIYEVWTRARPANDFAMVRPLLEKTLDLSRELAGFFPYQHIADPLIDLSDPGFTAAQVQALFADLRRDLAPLVEQVTSQSPSDNSCLFGHFPLDKQGDFVREAVSAIGYDWNRGRMDETHHPFMTKFSLGDVRITVRSSESDIQQWLFGALHEAGHALYEQGIDAKWEGTPVAEGASSGLHESQSRLWENLVGRSDSFWQFFYPRLQGHFPEQLGNVELKNFLSAINRVEKSPIRTEADELTYNLHVMIRFELELAMLTGELEIRDLPDAWRQLYKRDMNLDVADDRDGCLQDVHWYSGSIGGAFQGYTLGNILSAQFFEAAQKAQGSLNVTMQNGEFGQLRGWLTENLYRFGRALEPQSLITNATNSNLQTAPYLQYLQNKFGG